MRRLACEEAIAEIQAIVEGWETRDALRLSDTVESIVQVLGDVNYGDNEERGEDEDR